MVTRRDDMYVAELLSKQDELHLSAVRREVLEDLRQARPFVKQWHRGVCKIVRKDDDGVVREQGSGFHWGGGWVLTNAHVFNLCVVPSESQDKSYDYSGEDCQPTEFVDTKKLQFEFYDLQNDSKPIVFLPHTRLAVVADINDLEPDPESTTRTSDKEQMIKNADLAMIKLGIQFEYGRTQSSEWEIKEQDRISNIPAFCQLHLDTSVERAGEMDVVYEKAFPIHFGSANQGVQVSRPRRASIHDQNSRLIQFESYVCNGSSGAPLFAIVGDNVKLIGVVEGRGQPYDAIAIDSQLIKSMTSLHQHAQRLNAFKQLGSGVDHFRIKMLDIEVANNLILMWVGLPGEVGVAEGAWVCESIGQN